MAKYTKEKGKINKGKWQNTQRKKAKYTKENGKIKKGNKAK